MGKRSKIRRAVEKEPKKFISKSYCNQEPRASGAEFKEDGTVVPTKYIWDAPYRRLVESILKKLGEL